jgi:hypothetical protein
VSSPASLWFKPLTGQSKTRSLVTFDLEGGGGPGGFVCGAVVTDKGSSFYTSAYPMHQELLHYAHRRAWVFAHNLQYDLPLLEAEAFPKGELLFTRHGLLWSTYLVGKVKFRLFDSLNLFPRMSIASLGEMIGYPKLELPDHLLRQLSKGRPFAFFTPAEQELIKSYCIRDAEILHRALSTLQEIALSAGGQLRPTIAGTAMDVFRRKFMIWPWPVVGPATNRLVHPAYYGGRCENFAFGVVPGVNAYDVTSLYPYVQSRTKYPHPRYLSLNFLPRSYGWLEDREGVVECTVQIPETFIPPLPHRYSRRLFFPTGKIHGAWTISEIRHAVTRGCRLESVEWVLGSKVTFNPFQDFVERLFAMRHGFQEASDRRSELVKLLLNSLYGRWGLSPDSGLFTLINLDQPGEVEIPDGAVTIVNTNGLYAYAPVADLKQPDYVNLLFAAQIAAAGRLHLLEGLEAQDESSIYCDTDSILTTGEIPQGEGLGEWRREAYNVTADLYSPKEYSYTLAGGETFYHVKGVPPQVAPEYFKTGIARYMRALAVREAIARDQNPSEWVQVVKRRQGLLPKRMPLRPTWGVSNSWVSSRPYQVGELGLACSETPLPPDGEAWDPGPLMTREARGEQINLF